MSTVTTSSPRGGGVSHSAGPPTYPRVPTNPTGRGRNPGDGDDPPPPDGGSGRGGRLPDFRDNSFDRNPHSNFGRESGRCSYADQHRFYDTIIKKEKLASLDPLKILNHLRNFDRWMVHSPPPS